MDIEDTRKGQVKESLQKKDIHEGWESAYRTPENEKFYELAFDWIIHNITPPADSLFLDAGCGNCSHSIHLAKRGFKVQAVDFSESVLGMAEENVRLRGFTERIKIQREDLTALSFENETFSHILCWGVLMHIPDVEKAIGELARVLKPGGILIISEGNMYELQSVVLNVYRLLTGKKMEEFKRTPTGIERWKQTPVGSLFVRQADIGWLVKRLEKQGLVVKKRIAGQFTELYTKVSHPILQKLIHRFNNFWFRYIRIPYLSFVNILILQKI